MKEKGEDLRTDKFSDWQTIYKDLAMIIGEENTLKIFNNYKGISVSFPMKLFSKEGLENVVRNEYNGKNANSIALKHGYSVRQINRVIKEIKNKDNKE